MNEKEIIEKINKDYLEVCQSQKYKLGDLLFGVLDGIKSFDIMKCYNNLNLLVQGIRLQSYNTSKLERYIEQKRDYDVIIP